MIKNISFGHYKAFEKGDIEIRPLTFLLGANSVGKSSILQLILSLQQTALCDANYRSALKLNGGYVTLGENVNLFRKKDINSPINIKITFENEDIYSSLKEGYLDNYIEEIVTFSASIDRTVVFEDGITMAKMNQEEEGIFAILKKAFNFSTKKEIDIHDYLFYISNKTSKIDKKIFYQIIETIAKKLADKSIKKKDVDENYFFYRSRSFNYFTISERKDEFLLCYDYLSELSENISSKLFSINFELKSKERSDILFISKVSFYNENFEILSLEFEQNHDFKLHRINSKLIDNSGKFSPNIFQSLKTIFDNPRTIFDFIKQFDEIRLNERKQSVFSFTIGNTIKMFLNVVEKYFNDKNIYYVGPLRAHPKRYYFLDKAKTNTYVDTVDGDALAEILKENNKLKEQVNTWLKRFKLEVDVNQLQDVIHRLRVTQNSLRLDITDVGFGISQVLPVIVQGFLSTNNSVTLIEQPEIHLHPRMQAELADLFIDIVLEKSKGSCKKSLLIETHSEYLLKRLRRRISEGLIKKEDVAIYTIEPQSEKGAAKIKRLDISEKGDFEWPSDYYIDSLDDTLAFLKNL